ncbi:ABC transporter permease [Pontibacter sp. 172403-2]|uniref:ABC transporter permease n=1 Tax=Pontibacter rufus TaxID=2791028 RepID=UPI0018AF6059|nr:ABC transporter permease [Pontibacter sp. 172403-2]MBF9254882.1 ABC transporter permease [Pontibacter sp. 172403-2]
MRYYLLKRLFLAIPVLWLLATLVFMLSRLLPGSYAAESILQEGNGYYAKGSAADRATAYQQYLIRTGQHLPLFYFSVSSGATPPDSLLRLLPEAAQHNLQQLAWHIGNWQEAYTFWRTLQELQLHAGPAELQALAPFLQTITTTTNVQQRVEAARAIIKYDTASPLARKLYRLALKLQQQHRLSFMIPSLRWHGTANQYHKWLTGILHGNLGNSYRDSRSVTDIIVETSANTFWIIFISMLLTTLAALELSIKLMQPRYKQWRKAVMPLLFLIDSIPLFVLALLLLVLFASPAFLQLFPVYGLGYGYGGQTRIEQITHTLPYLVLPILCLSLAHLPYLVNQFYNALSAAESMDYTRTARAKGLPYGLIIRKHMLRNALLPIITLLSDFLPALIAGSVIIETIFAIPGMGRLLVTSVQARDYPLLVAIVLVVAVAKVVSHVLADICYAYADPRIRYQSQA